MSKVADAEAVVGQRREWLIPGEPNVWVEVFVLGAGPLSFGQPTVTVRPVRGDGQRTVTLNLHPPVPAPGTSVSEV